MEAYTWRRVIEADLPALAALDAACRVVDGPASVPDPTYAGLLVAPNTTLLCAVGGDDPEHLAAAGWEAKSTPTTAAGVSARTCCAGVSRPRGPVAHPAP